MAIPVEIRRPELRRLSSRREGEGGCEGPGCGGQRDPDFTTAIGDRRQIEVPVSVIIRHGQIRARSPDPLGELESSGAVSFEHDHVPAEGVDDRQVGVTVLIDVRCLRERGLESHPKASQKCEAAMTVAPEDLDIVRFATAADRKIKNAVLVEVGRRDPLGDLPCVDVDGCTEGPQAGARQYGQFAVEVREEDVGMAVRGDIEDTYRACGSEEVKMLKRPERSILEAGAVKSAERPLRDDIRQSILVDIAGSGSKNRIIAHEQVVPCPEGPGPVTQEDADI